MKVDEEPIAVVLVEGSAPCNQYCTMELLVGANVTQVTTMGVSVIPEIHNQKFILIAFNFIVYRANKY